MQKPVKRGNVYRITLRFNNERYTATRDTANECEQWASKKLIELQSNPQSIETEKIHLSFYSLFEQYYNEQGKHMKSAKLIYQYLKTLKKLWGQEAELSIHHITPQIVKAWRDKRLKKVKAATVIRQMGVYSSAYEFARRELFLTKENPFKEITKPAAPPPRSNRITDQDVAKMCKVLKYKPGTQPTQPRHWVAWSFMFAIETAMRKGEILSIRHRHIHPDYIRLYDTKNGTNRDVALTANAQKLLSWIQMNPLDDRLVPHNGNSFRLIWQRYLKISGNTGKFTFHDSRHEAITRFVHNYKLPVEVLAKITGHKTIEVLVNTYYNPTASEIAKMLNA